MRRVLIDTEKAHQSVNQVVESGRKVGSAVIVAAPAIQAQAIVFVFFERRGVEYAENIFANLNRLDVVVRFARGAPVERIDILQNSEKGLVGQALLEQSGQMLGREVRFAEENDDQCIRMATAEIGDFVGGMAIT